MSKLEESFRHSISEDEISQARFNAIYKSTQELMVKFPELELGVSLFGSLSKGKGLDRLNSFGTDIDLRIFYKRNEPDENKRKDLESFIKDYLFQSLYLDKKCQISSKENQFMDVEFFAIQKFKLPKYSSNEPLIIPRQLFPQSLVIYELLMGVDVGGGIQKFYLRNFFQVLYNIALHRTETEKEGKTIQAHLYDLWYPYAKEVQKRERSSGVKVKPGYQISDKMKRNFPSTFEQALNRYNFKLVDGEIISTI